MPKYLPVRAELTAQGYTFTYEWSRKAVKNFNLRVRPDGGVAVSSPTRVTKAQLEAFLISHVDFIIKAKAKMAAHHPEERHALDAGDRVPIFGKTHTVCLLRSHKYGAYAQNGTLYLCLPYPEDASARVRLFWRFAAKEVEREMATLTARFAPFFLSEGAPPPPISLRRMKSRWGVCYCKEKRICYNTNLIFMPHDCLVYVVCHELAHFRHPDHSAAFYAWLARVLPDHAERRRLLHTAPVAQISE